jgi:hypothetical protein
MLWVPPTIGGLTQRWYYRVLKAADLTFYVGWIWLTWRFLDDELHWSIPVGCALLSGGWLALTFARTRHLLKTYFDVLSRLEFTLPSAAGASLAGFAGLTTHLPSVRAVAILELAGWALLLGLYRRNRRRYVRQGHGPLPAGCWISPPARVLRPGDLILTSGLVAAGLRESVGHGETVVRTGGDMQSFSSYMDKGAVLHPVAGYTSFVREHGHYVVLRLRDGLSPERELRAAEIAHAMLLENQGWRDAVNRRRRRIIERLPLPSRWRDRLISATRSAGYDWIGLFMGRIAPQRWTCIGACLELYRRLGVPTNDYGTGLLGFGTSLLDPIMPVRFLSDPAFRVLANDDRESENSE